MERRGRLKLLLLALGLCLLISFLLLPLHNAEEGHKLPIDHSQHKLAVIVPFRDRFEELQVFAPHLHKFLKDQGHTHHHIYIVNQVDTFRFNRAALVNVGFRLASPNFDYMAMHDVDLLPLNPALPYGFPGEGVAMHVAHLHPKYNYPSFIGGILVLTAKDFAAVNGMSNIYWGWGMEDDEFYVRLKHGGIVVRKPQGLSSGRKDTFRHIHSPKLRPRDREKCYDQLEKTRKKDKLTGLHNLNFSLVSTSEMLVQDAPITIFNVQLTCDPSLSPWCSCPPQNNNSQS